MKYIALSYFLFVGKFISHLSSLYSEIKFVFNIIIQYFVLIYIVERFLKYNYEVNNFNKIISNKKRQKI